jgi:hypothetical protein
VDELYALAPGEFVGARNALAKQMKADGRRDDAAVVAKLRKPSVVAWALNQAVRDAPDSLAAMIDAAGRQAVAQQDLLDGGDADALRDATAERRDAARAVVQAAVAHAGATHADAVRTTLDAAVADPDLVPLLRRGVLTDTLDAPAGFGFGFGLGDDTDDEPAAPRRRPRASAGHTSPAATEQPDPGSDGRDDADERARLEAAEAARREARSMITRLEREVARAEKWVGRAERSVTAAAQELIAATEALAAAQERADEAEAEQQRADVELSEREAERDHQSELLAQARALLDDLDGDA